MRISGAFVCEVRAGLDGQFLNGAQREALPVLLLSPEGVQLREVWARFPPPRLSPVALLPFPRRRLRAFFREVVRDVWRQKHADHEALVARLEKDIALLEVKDQRLVDLFVNEQINKATYDDQRGKVGTMLNDLRRQESETLVSREQVDCLLDFAEWMLELERVAGVWNSAALPNKLRNQEAFFPQGLILTKEGFGIPLAPYFSSSSSRF